MKELKGSYFRTGLEESTKQQEDSGNSINNNETKLVSLVTNEVDFDRCSKFIEEVREDRYGKVKDRQVRKFHNLINKSKTNNNRLEQDGNAINAGHSDSHDNNTSNQSVITVIVSGSSIFPKLV